MRIVDGSQQRLLLVSAAQLPHRRGLQQTSIKPVPVLETRGAHALRRRDHILGRIGERHVKGTKLTAQKPGRGEGLEFFTLTNIQALADVNESRHCGVLWAKGTGHHRPDVRTCDRLRWRVAGMPVKLMPRVEDESQITRRISTDQGAAIHHLSHLLQPLTQANTIHRCRD